MEIMLRLTSNGVADEEDGLRRDFLGVATDVGRHPTQAENEGAGNDADHDPEAEMRAQPVGWIDHDGTGKRDVSRDDSKGYAGWREHRHEGREGEADALDDACRALGESRLQRDESKTSNDEAGTLLPPLLRM